MKLELSGKDSAKPTVGGNSWALVTVANARFSKQGGGGRKFENSEDQKKNFSA